MGLVFYCQFVISEPLVLIILLLFRIVKGFCKNFRIKFREGGIIALTAVQPFTSVLVCSQQRFFKHEWIWIKNRGSNFANTVREPMREHEFVLIFLRGKWTYNKQTQERTGGRK